MFSLCGRSSRRSFCPVFIQYGLHFRITGDQEGVISFAREILRDELAVDYLEDQILPSNAMIFFTAMLDNGSALFALPDSVE